MFRSPIFRGTGLFRRGAGGAGGGGPLAPWEQILALAQEDEWTALYDVSNPNTRTLEEDDGSFFLVNLQDSLGNLPALNQGTASRRFLLSEGHINGAIDATVHGPRTSPTAITAAFTGVSQPDFMMGLVESPNTPGAFDTFVSDPWNASGYNQGIRNNPSEAVARNGTLTNMIVNGLMPAGNHVHGALFNGTSGSQVYLNGDLMATGNLNSGTTRTRIRWGSGATTSTSETASVSTWAGALALLVYFAGNPSSGMRSRMEDLLMELAGIS